MTIQEIQNEIIAEFSLLDGDKEMILTYIMELGERLPPMDESLKVEENIIKGCQSKVWLSTRLEGDKVLYLADSNTQITKGLISLLIRVLSGQKPEDIMTADLYFIEKIGMGQVIGSQRSNGFSSMIKQMRLYAVAYQTKLQS
ncbi:SufE family protein [Cytophagales bacterium LB-30]|uniref:SufE family protein n=1 Tax=Shiella aurantiaca TaxID=3058365 RepID=A0ABT8F0N9_9BACT|nr:SufE family protein [Shiella aurantiaca]MDN4163909.1 SufE family protein [Shiella aurantiaca]